MQALQSQQYTSAMWLLLSQLKQYFGGLVGANCYITPVNSQGLAPHYDDVEVFVLQLEGTKAWKLYHPSLSLSPGPTRAISHARRSGNRLGN